MTKKKKIVITLLCMLLVIGNIFFLCQDTCGQYKGVIKSEKFNKTDTEYSINFYNNHSCKLYFRYFIQDGISTTEQEGICFYFYHIKENKVCLHSGSSYCVDFTLERVSVFKILAEDEKTPLISTQAILIQVFFSILQLVVIGYIVYNKVKEKQSIRDSIVIKKTEI